MHLKIIKGFNIELSLKYKRTENNEVGPRAQPFPVVDNPGNKLIQLWIMCCSQQWAKRELGEGRKNKRSNENYRVAERNGFKRSLNFRKKQFRKRENFRGKADRPDLKVKSVVTSSAEKKR